MQVTKAPYTFLSREHRALRSPEILYGVQAMTTVKPLQDGYLTVQVQVGQLFESDTWISYTPELKTIAQGDTRDSSLDNLCNQVKEVCDFFLETGRSPLFQAVDSEDSLQPFPFRKTILVNFPRYVRLR